MYQSLTIVGNLTQAPTMRYAPSGVAVTSFGVAVNKAWTDASGERKDKVTYFRISAWRKLAEVCDQHLTKGRQVMIVGEVEEPNVYNDKRTGEPVASLNVTAQVVKFLGGRDDELAKHGPTARSESAESEDEIPF